MKTMTLFVDSAIAISLLISSFVALSSTSSAIAQSSVQPSVQSGVQPEAIDRLWHQQKLGTTSLNQGHYREAITILEPLLPIAVSLKQQSTQAIVLSNLGIAYKNLGNYGKASKLQRQAGGILFKLSNSTQGDSRTSLRQALGQVLSNLGNAEEAQGNYAQAKQAYEQSLKLTRETGDRSGESLALNNLGGVISVLGEDDRAIDYLNQSLHMSQALQNRSLQASTLLTIGTIHHFRHQPNEIQTAIGHYQASLTLAIETQDKPLQAEVLSSLGTAYEDLKDYNQAIEFHQKSIALANAIGDPEIHAKALNNLGHTFLSTGRLPESIATLRQAIALLDRLRLGLTDNYKVSIFDTQIHIYNLLQQVLIANQQPEEALEASEQGRARAFAERLSQTHETAPITLPQIRQIAQKQQATIVEYAIVPDDDFKFRGKQRGRESELFIWVIQPTGKVDFRRVDLKSLWQTKGTLSQIITTARCLRIDCPTIEEVAQQTRGDRSSITVDPIAPPKAPVQQTPISDASSPLNYPGLPELHQLLIKPIADLLPKDVNSPVLFIPQESLFLVPFAALPDAKGRYLIESHTILSAPSIQVLGLTQARSDQLKAQMNAGVTSALVVGNPSPMPENLDSLPNAEKEAIEVAKILNTTAIIGKAATKDHVMQQFSNARIIHLATHGLLERGQSTQLDAPGAIALAPSNSQENGLLTAEEIIRLSPSLKSELVVLSACDTGRGRVTGDGVLGLSRSWIGAGVPRVLVSLWAVNDESTAMLMVDFYQHLAQQSRNQVGDRSNYSVALRQAMLKTMKVYPEPSHWAAFMLVGQ
jgi:CHAT domain-containing protein